MKMTKSEVIRALKACYRIGNASDSDDSPEREDWTHPNMACDFCRALDAAFHSLRSCGVISGDEHQEIYDTL